MVDRADVVQEALKWNGNGNGEGYPGYRNPFSEDLGRPNEFWCGDFVTDIYKRVGLALPSMQIGCRTGYAYCPSGLDSGEHHHAVIPSWHAKPGDMVFINTRNGTQPGHTELVTAWHGGTLFTIGGDSGPSNIDKYQGQGGVHRHMWSAPAGQGNNAIMGVVDASKFVKFGAPAHHHKPGQPPGENPRYLMLKSPLMHGADVKHVQEALNHHGAKLALDGVFGIHTRNAVVGFQHSHNLNPDGIVGLHTRKALGL